VSIWIIIVLATAGGGALLVWHNATRTKHASEEMLSKYAEMLATAREEKEKRILEAEEEARKVAQKRQAETEPRARSPAPHEPA